MRQMIFKYQINYSKVVLIEAYKESQNHTESVTVQYLVLHMHIRI